MVSTRSDSPGYNRLSKTELEQFPIDYEDKWPVGPHLITTHDLSKGPDRLIQNITEMPDLIYVDPPWGGANASTFRRKAEVPGKADFHGLIRTLSRIIVHCGTPPTVVEMGVRWVPAVKSIFESVGIPGPIHEVPGTYYRKNPMVYLLINMPGQVANALANTDDEYSPGIVMDTMGLPAGAKVLDPMCGRGLTAAHAVERKLVFQGNELAPFRAAAAIAVLTGAMGG